MHLPMKRICKMQTRCAPYSLNVRDTIGNYAECDYESYLKYLRILCVHTERVCVSAKREIEGGIEVSGEGDGRMEERGGREGEGDR